MGFSLDDMIAVLAKSKAANCELFHEEATVEKTLSLEEAKAMFPDTKFDGSDSVVYVPLKMCHSLPKINQRGRCFTAKTLANSFHTAVDTLINIEHGLIANETSDRDRIVGHIKSASFKKSDIDTHKAALERADVTPSEPIPLYALGAIYLRADGAKRIVEEYLHNQVWKTSMECGHDWKDAYFLYRGDYIPIKDAEDGMRECVDVHSIKKYKNHELAAVIGGLNGHIDFWGLGLTKSPADEDSGILAMFASQSRELASRKMFYLPLHFQEIKNEKSLEAASIIVDRKLHELANVSVIGETEPAEPDQHVHLVLSDLSVFPAMGHSHCMHTQALSRGTKPTLTARTSEHYSRRYDPDSGSSMESVHAHLVNIPLLGKFTPVNSDATITEGESGVIVIDIPETANIGEEDQMKLTEITKALEKLTGDVASLVAAKTDDERNRISNEISSTMKVVSNASNQASFDEAIKATIEEKVKAGEILLMDKANELIEQKVGAALKEEREKHETEIKKQKVKQDRLDVLRKENIDLEVIYDDITDAEGKPMTIAKHLDEIPLEDEKSFKLNLALWRGIAAKAEQIAQQQQQQQQEQQQEEQQKLEAANNAKKVQQKTIKGMVSGKSGEAASATPPELANLPPQMRGRHVFSSR